MTKSFKIIWLLLFLFVATGHSQIRTENNKTEQFAGVFKYGNFSTELILDIQRQQDLNQVFFSSPDQNAYEIPAQEVFLKSDSIGFVLQSDLFRYEFQGVFAGDELVLNLSVDNSDYPFTLVRSSAGSEKQLGSRDIRFRSGDLLLYGTVYFPVEPNGKAIYLVTSSGDQDRSASRAEARFLARQGYVTLHADKRGTGMSDGNWEEASIPELCSDDMMAITYLAETNNLNYNNIGIKGSSQGASKVPYILSQMPELGFGIVISCPASSLLESDLNFWKNRTRNELSEDDLNRAEKMQSSVFLYISGELPRSELEEELQSVADESWMPYVWVPELDSVRIDKKLSYTPIPWFEQTKAPLLVIQGSSDQIIPCHSLKSIRDLTEKRNPQNHYVELMNADHAMMFKGESDFPYWPALHPDYRKEMMKWLHQLQSRGK